MHAFGFSLCFAFYPSAVSFAAPLDAASLVQQLLGNLKLEECLANWEGKYFSFVGLELSV